MNHNTHKARIAITMGDPGGIGPEVTVKALLSPDVRGNVDPVIVGKVAILTAAAESLDAPVRFESIASLTRPAPEGCVQDIGLIVPVFDPTPEISDFAIGRVHAANGRASYAYIVAAAEAAIAGEVDGICTAPISKEALFEAGYTVPGHTELLASLCGTDIVRMMLVGGGLQVVLQTIHVPFTTVPGLLSTEKILTSLRIIADFARRISDDELRVVVCGLNPHASENGHFGNEEAEIITPAITAAVAEGIDVTGPLPADTVFHRVLQGEFDFVLAMYHDQGLIPVKTLDFSGGVNVTLGLPIVRTSPDHGTAFGIAGQGIADENSMAAALKYAARVARKAR